LSKGKFRKQLAIQDLLNARVLRYRKIDTGSVDRLDSLGPISTQGGNVAAVENTAPPQRSATGTGAARAAGQQYGWQRTRPLAPRKGQGPFCRAFQCLLQIARSSFVIRGLLAQPLEPPYTDPYVRWCGRGRRVTAPIPINTGLCAERLPRAAAHRRLKPVIRIRILVRRAIPACCNDCSPQILVGTRLLAGI
jgi:hypothetical protein